MSRSAEVGELKSAAERRDPFDGRQLEQDKLMNRGLSYVTAGGAMVVVMTWQRMFMLRGVGALSVLVASALAKLVMGGMLRDVMPMRMGPRCQQTVRQVQQNCTEGDEFEVLAEHGGHQCCRL